MSDLGAQINIKIDSMKAKIAQRIIYFLSSVEGIRSINYDDVKILQDDFNDSELPALQFFGLKTRSVPEGVRRKLTWDISIEIVLKSTSSKGVKQSDLWNFETAVKNAIDSSGNLKIPGVISVLFLGDESDLHLIKPYYISRLDFAISFYEDRAMC